MEKLCFGIFVKFIVNASVNGENQSTWVRCFREIANEQNIAEMDSSNASNYVLGERPLPLSFSRALRETIIKLNLANCFKNQIENKITKRLELIQALKKVVEFDEGLKKDSVIGYMDFYNKEYIVNTTAVKFCEFLANIFYYCVVIDKNEDHNSYLKGLKKRGSLLNIFSENRKMIEFLHEDDVDSLFSDDNIKQEEKDNLLIESEGFCPGKNCSMYLALNGSTQNLVNYEIVQIDPKGEFESKNLIVLCSNCAAIHRKNPSIESVKYLKNKKNELQKKALIKKNISGTENVGQGIKNLLEKLPQGAFDYNNKCAMKPFKLERKLQPNNDGILHEVKNSLPYFKQVKEASKQLSEEKEFSFEIVRQSLNILFRKLQSQGLSIEEIFGGIVEKLIMDTGEGRVPCVIVVTYFIQNCDIFDANTK